MAAAYVANAALKAQEADSDTDVTLVLQRLVGDELDRQIERLAQPRAGSAARAFGQALKTAPPAMLGRGVCNTGGTQAIQIGQRN
jgi:hypothetical protein